MNKYQMVTSKGKKYDAYNWYRFVGDEDFCAGPYHVMIMDKQRRVNILSGIAIDRGVVMELTAENFYFMIIPDYDYK